MEQTLDDNHEDDDDDDILNRKPAARPVIDSEPQQQQLPSTMEDQWDNDNDNDNNNNNNNNINDENELDYMMNGSQQQYQQQQDHDNGVLPVSVVGEIPFLVTHWLSGYALDDTSTTRTTPSIAISRKERNAALAMIQKATEDIATAFQTLGAFGKSVKPRFTIPSLDDNFISSKVAIQPEVQNNSYSDMKRSWPTCGTDHLNKVLYSSQLATSAIYDTTTMGSGMENHIHASSEAIAKHLQTSKNVGGRTLQDPVAVSEEGSDHHISTNVTVISTLNAPVAIAKQIDTVVENNNDSVRATESGSSTTVALHLVSKTVDVATTASISMRQYLDLRTKCQNQNVHIKKLKRSLQHQQNLYIQLDEERSKLTANESNQIAGGVANVSTAMIVQMDNIQVGMQNCERVIAQLQRQLPQLERALQLDNLTLATLKQRSINDYSACKSCLENYRDPIRMVVRPGLPNNRITMNVMSRQFGIDRYMKQSLPRTMGRIRSVGTTVENRKAILYSKLSHAATINTHLAYPVYCLRFDRTGQYFITGADDYLVKVFCISGNLSIKKRGLIDPLSCFRGAVLVCTLKGHAGVINDIGVSSDNTFLATASDDGDCRVWGLKDGRPITILRGHVGGATSVSWSMLTPYRLVTTGADGLARNWDIRKALLKRYGKFVGNRPEYIEVPTIQDCSPDKEGEPSDEVNNNVVADSLPILPLPVREGDHELIDTQEQVQLPVLPIPALPNAAVLEDQPNNEIETEDGRFVANDNIEDCVQIISRLQHGAAIDERDGPGTRARRSVVKVICVVHCPYGGHFATGSDDGICRIWQDEDDSVVESIDSFQDTSNAGISSCLLNPLRSRNTADRLLLTLQGHLSAITDLHYSNLGDRILTASQKDGVIRIWSWSADPLTISSQSGNQETRIRSTSHILLKLTNPISNSTTSTVLHQGPRARPNRSQASRIMCDVAVWTCDDSKIVSSQSELAKENSTSILPGSQYLFLWDSFTGHCLLGIPNAHKMDCQVILPHPLISSVICSAGADGIVKLWDLEAGKCIFTHENTATFGPIDTLSERGKNICYLDGDFSPDGTTLALSDESGRITVIDSFGPEINQSRNLSSFPEWMKEQYFSNDYYDLLYDSNGYCVERGSELPPHLSPKGVRCSHSGTPFPSEVNEAFKGLIGPSTINEDAARWKRQQIRAEARVRRNCKISIKGNVVRQYDSKLTVLFGQSSENAHTAEPKQTTQSRQSESVGTIRSPAEVSNSSARRLSSNYRWRDYNDLDFGDDENDHETDDEDFELHETNTPNDRISNGRISRVVDSDSDESMEGEDDEPSRPASRTNRRTITALGESSDDEYVEYVSSNNTPTGSYIADYDLHFFRMMSRDEGNNVHRQWLRRSESSSSYGGRKLYNPQVGDSVVYIPRAHQSTLAAFPGVQTPPWQQWPSDAVWPVVRCCVRNIRFRFPYKAYNKEVVSVVAKLVLEVTGIPDSTNERAFGWPDPTFANITEPFVFELALFENKEDDYIIPLGLYVSRLQQLENALTNHPREVRVEAFYADSDERNDVEDSSFVTYIGRVVRFADNFDEDVNNPNLFGSGFFSLAISWDDGTDNDPDQVSPWEVSPQSATIETEAPERPRLSEAEKCRIRDGIKNILRLPGGKDYFLNPVDVAKYSDYATRVEVPMDVSFIKDRLEADYYGSRYSAVADVMLILNNCKKYNGDNDELSDIANEMLKVFEECALDNEERIWFHKFDNPITDSPLQGNSTINADVARNSDGSNSAVLRKSRRHIQARSSLENIQGSAKNSRAETRPTTGSRNVNQSRVRITRRTQQVERSVLETARPAQVQTLEQLSSSQGRSTRGRVTRSATVATQASSSATDQRNEHPRRNLRIRGSHSNPAYAEEDRSDIDDVDQNHTVIATRQRNNRGNEPRPDTQPSRSRAGISTQLTITAPLINDSNTTYIPPSPSVQTNVRSSRRNRNVIADAQSPSRPENGSRSSRHVTRSSNLDTELVCDEARAEPPVRKSVNRSKASPKVKVASSDDESECDKEASKKQVHKRNTRAKLSNVYKRNSRTVAADQYSDVDSPDDLNGKRKRSSRSRKHEASDHESDLDESDSYMDEKASESDSLSSSSNASYRGKIKKERLRSSTSRKGPTKESKVGSTTIRGKDMRLKNSRGSPCRRARAQTSYYDPSSSDIDMDDAEDNESVRSVPPKAVKKTNKDQRKDKPVLHSKKKMKVNGEDVDLLEKYQIEKWQEIPLKKISDVSRSLLEELRSSDKDDLFAIPVVEAYPDLKDVYLQRISKPMDFRTIEEERLWYYQSIRELQQDLLLVFHNCMEYNEPDSPLYETASLMMGLLNDLFRDVCSNLGVRLRHH